MEVVSELLADVVLWLSELLVDEMMHEVDVLHVTTVFSGSLTANPETNGHSHMNGCNEGHASDVVNVDPNNPQH